MMAATCLWANYQLQAPNGWLTPESGFVYVGTQFYTPGTGSINYTITALTPAVFAASNAGLGQDGLNPLPATSVHGGDTVTITPAIGGVSTFPTSILSGMVRLGG